MLIEWVATGTLPGGPIELRGADRYTLNGATAVATLYANATTATSNPAVTLLVPRSQNH